jgi:imidazolonepropionase-like amidohydrolase
MTMKKIYSTILALSVTMGMVQAQEVVYPSRDAGRVFITNGTVHVGNGTVIENATIEINNGKIVSVTPSGSGSGGKVIDAKGKHVYPGLILSSSDLGLKEIGAGVRASNDFSELGDINPSVRSIVAYNTDSRVINVLRSNGVLLANVVPGGGSVSGSSSVVQLDAWNWEDAAYKMDGGIHVNMPSFLNRGRRGGGGGFPPGGFPGFGGAAQGDPIKAALDRVEEIKSFFRQAKAWHETPHTTTNLKLDAVKGLFNKTQKLFVHGDQVKQMLVAIDFAKEFGFDVVIVGGSESFQIADLLKANNIAVILAEEHALPASEDDDVDQPYKTPAALQKAGVLFALNDTDASARYRNLSYNAGTAATYGLTKEQALQAITLNAAKILGIDARTGSLEAGKDANILITEGDLLDMKSSSVLHAFIQGREISLDNKQKQLYERYKFKYGIK